MQIGLGELGDAGKGHTGVRGRPQIIQETSFPRIEGIEGSMPRAARLDAPGCKRPEKSYRIPFELQLIEFAEAQEQFFDSPVGV